MIKYKCPACGEHAVTVDYDNNTFKERKEPNIRGDATSETATCETCGIALIIDYNDYTVKTTEPAKKADSGNRCTVYEIGSYECVPDALEEEIGKGLANGDIKAIKR
jgi:predicted RNA-binding Zn-ribbon protein involved in translation (DUF1610 family)